VAEFLAMGGYGAFVWTAFGFTILVMAGLFWLSWRAAGRREAELARLRRELRPERPRRPRPLTARPEPENGGPMRETA
jgi:heme exporter protein D